MVDFPIAVAVSRVLAGGTPALPGLRGIQKGKACCVAFDYAKAECNSALLISPASLLDLYV
jgi:hypothetical protein